MATQPQNCVFKIPFGKNMKEKYVFCVPCYVLFVWESAFCDQNTVPSSLGDYSMTLNNCSFSTYVSKCISLKGDVETFKPN